MSKLPHAAAYRTQRMQCSYARCRTGSHQNSNIIRIS